MSEPKVGQPFGRYTIEAILGRGGMGVVYRATDSRLERVVALKTLGSERSADPAFRERFLRESRTLARLKHPHIVPIWEADEAAGELYIAMQYVEGQELGTLLERAGPLEPARAVELIAQVADALDAAHAAGLVHRDVKPANILVERGRRGILDHAYLTDFGLTKPVAALSGLTMAGQFVGTPGYVAPEQIEGKPVDHRADIYALGCVLYNCLTGTVPFPRDSTIAALWAHLWEPPPRPSEVRSELPAGFDAVVATALAKTPGERYQTAGALASAARAALASEVAVISDPVLASPPTSPTPGPTGRSDEGTGGSATGPTPAGSPPTFVDHVRPPTEPPGPPVPSTPPVSPPARVSLPWAGRLRRLPGTIAQRPVLFAGGATAFVVGLLVVALVGGAIRLGPASVPVSSPGASAGVAGETPGSTKATQVILFASDRDGPFDLFAASLDGTDLSKLTDSGRDNIGPAISPDGQRIAFGSYRDGRQGIFVMDVDGGNLIRLAAAADADDQDPAWSPDSRQIAFSSNRDRVNGSVDLYLINVDGTALTRLTSTADVDEFQPAWSPDGRKLAFASAGTDGLGDVFVMNADGTELTKLTSNPENDATPDWSPDGSRFAFWSVREGNEEVFVMDADGRNEVNLTKDPAVDDEPSWAPDGASILFSSDRAGDPEIYRMNSDGTGLRKLIGIGSASISPKIGLSPASLGGGMPGSSPSNHFGTAARVVLQDDFSDPTSGFGRCVAPCSPLFYYRDDGTYEISGTAGSNEGARYALSLPIYNWLGDTHLEIDVSWPSATQTNWVALECRNTSTTNSVFYIYGDGRYEFRQFYGTEWTTLSSGQSGVRSGVTSRFGLDCVGGGTTDPMEMSAFVNGNQLDTYVEGVYGYVRAAKAAARGSVAVLAGTTKAGDTYTAVVDNLQLLRLDGPPDQ